MIYIYRDISLYLVAEKYLFEYLFELYIHFIDFSLKVESVFPYKLLVNTMIIHIVSLLIQQVDDKFQRIFDFSLSAINSTLSNRKRKRISIYLRFIYFQFRIFYKYIQFCCIF